MFKKKEKTMKEPKEKKVRTMKVGTHKKSVLLLWAVLLASTSFGVYKNFTAIDTHTVHEKEIIQLKLNDTNGIENFVKNFAKAYYTWDTSTDSAHVGVVDKIFTRVGASDNISLGESTFIKDVFVGLDQKFNII